MSNTLTTVLAQRQELGQSLKWGGVRLFIEFYVMFCLFTVVGGLLTAPVATKIFFGDWRFWRYLKEGPKIYAFLVKSAWRIATSRGYGFMFSVPLTDPPLEAPDPSWVQLRDDWPHGGSCGDCTRCCDTIGCPIVAKEPGGGCRGYNSLFWRYFNCGRFPTSELQLDYYGCAKWELVQD